LFGLADLYDASGAASEEFQLLPLVEFHHIRRACPFFRGSHVLTHNLRRLKQLGSVTFRILSGGIMTEWAPSGIITLIKTPTFSISATNCCGGPPLKSRSKHERSFGAAFGGAPGTMSGRVVAGAGACARDSSKERPPIKMRIVESRFKRPRSFSCISTRYTFGKPKSFGRIRNCFKRTALSLPV
jgi:hypothetical protein